MKIHSLYGSPVAHSLSPIIFNTTFQKQSLNRAYVAFNVSRENLKQAIDSARTLEFAGFNLTMPLKTAVIEFLDSLDQSAELCGATNTVANTNKGLIGYNTDGEGALRALREYGFEPHGKHILILGAGGAARSLVQRLSKENCSSITILNRTNAKAKELADQTKGPTQISHGALKRKKLEDLLEETDLVVNATPIQSSTLLASIGISPNNIKNLPWIFDLAYDKRSEDLPTTKGMISPLEMLVQQAALSYEIWLGEPAPLSLMRTSLVDHLGRDWR